LRLQIALVSVAGHEVADDPGWRAVICSFASSESVVLSTSTSDRSQVLLSAVSVAANSEEEPAQPSCPRSLVRPNSGPCQPEPRAQSLDPLSLSPFSVACWPPPVRLSCAACSSDGDGVTAFQSRTNSTPTPGHPILLRHAAWPSAPVISTTPSRAHLI
jgi:hypothetical protein